MKNVNKITLIVLISISVLARLYPSFSQENLGPPSIFSTLSGQEIRDVGRIEYALLTDLLANDGKLEAKMVIAEDDSIYSPAILSDTTEWLPEISNNHFGVKCRTVDEFVPGKTNTYYIVYSSEDKDGDGIFLHEIFTEKEYGILKRMLFGLTTPLGYIPKRDELGRKRIASYIDHEKNIDAYIKNQILHGNFAVVDRFKGNPGKRECIPGKKAPNKTIDAEIWNGIEASLDNFLGLFGGSAKDAFKDREIIFIEMPLGEPVPVATIDGQAVFVNGHTSKNAVYAFIPSAHFKVMDASTPHKRHHPKRNAIKASVCILLHELGPIYNMPWTFNRSRTVNDVDRALQEIIRDVKIDDVVELLDRIDEFVDGEKKASLLSRYPALNKIRDHAKLKDIFSENRDYINAKYPQELGPQRKPVFVFSRMFTIGELYCLINLFRGIDGKKINIYRLNNSAPVKRLRLMIKNVLKNKKRVFNHQEMLGDLEMALKKREEDIGPLIGKAFGHSVHISEQKIARSTLEIFGIDAAVELSKKIYTESDTAIVSELLRDILLYILKKNSVYYSDDFSNNIARWFTSEAEDDVLEEDVAEIARYSDESLADSLRCIEKELSIGIKFQDDAVKAKLAKRFRSLSQAAAVDKVTPQKDNIDELVGLEIKDIGDITFWIEMAVYPLPSAFRHERYLSTTLGIFGNTHFRMSGYRVYTDNFSHSNGMTCFDICIDDEIYNAEYGLRTYKCEVSDDNSVTHVWPEEKSVKRTEKDKEAIRRYIEHEKTIDKWIKDHTEKEGNQYNIFDYPMIKRLIEGSLKSNRKFKKLNTAMESILKNKILEIFKYKRLTFIRSVERESLPRITIGEDEVAVMGHSSQTAIYIFLRHNEVLRFSHIFYQGGKKEGLEMTPQEKSEFVENVIMPRLLHEVGASCDMPYSVKKIGEQKRVANDFDTAYEEASKKSVAALKNTASVKRLNKHPLELVDLNANLNTRDYACGETEKRDGVNHQCQIVHLMADRAEKAGKSMMPGYTLLTSYDLYENHDEYLAEREGIYRSRFNLVRLGSDQPANIVQEILDHITSGVREQDIVVQLSGSFLSCKGADKAIERLKDEASEIRFMFVDTQSLHKQGMHSLERQKYRSDVYAMMLLLRELDKYEPKSKPHKYRLLRYLLDTHMDVGLLSLRDVDSDLHPDVLEKYILALLSGDVEYLIKENISAIPVSEHPMPDHHLVSQNLIFA